MKILGHAFLFLCLSFSSVALAREDVVLLTQDEIKQLIGHFPAYGSQEEFRDDEILLEWQSKRTKAECDYAASQEKVTIKSMFAGSRGPLTDQEVDALPFYLATQAKIEIGANSLVAKQMYDRVRPYDRNPLIQPCISKTKTTAYPSGHTTFAYAMGHLLANQFPGKREALLQRSHEASMNRVIGGVHHPSDIVAGKKLGEEIARRILQQRN